MSMTEDLRRMLDERGVEYRAISDATFWETHGGAFRYKAEPHADKLMVMTCCSQRCTVMTPKQAVEATLGREVTGETSDGYHTFNELYHHRAVLFSVIVRDHRELAWKSKAHHDGTMYDGMFIVGIETPTGQATYHYDIDPYWDMFDCKELDRAPEWDGHTSDEAIERIATLGHDNAGRYVGLRQGEYWERTENSDYYCGGCGWEVTDHDSYCPECGGALHKSALEPNTTTVDETDTWECVCDGIGHYGKRITVHVMECGECGGTYEYVNGSYEHCPRCGARIREVDE